MSAAIASPASTASGASPASPASPASAGIEARAWAALGNVPDPEIPVISLVDLGIIRHVRLADGVLEVGLSPTYSGCPATEVIRQDVGAALRSAGIDPVRIIDVLAPAWSSDWISEQGREALRRYGIAPPGRRSAASELPIACPRCGSARTTRVSEFGSTPCKALHRCDACLEPFEQFKCI